MASPTLSLSPPESNLLSPYSTGTPGGSLGPLPDGSPNMSGTNSNQRTGTGRPTLKSVSSSSTDGAEGEDSFSEGTSEGRGSNNSSVPRGKGKKGASDGKEKKTRNRKPSSCVPCRKKKLRCNRAAPCDQCTSKGNASGCTWEGTVPLFNARAQHDADELREQVARLEALVQYLTSNPQVDASNSYFPNPASHPPSLPLTPELAEFPSYVRPSPSASASQYLQGASPDASFSDHTGTHPSLPSPEFRIDLRSHDLCEALSHLAIRDFVVVDENNTGSESWTPSNWATSGGPGKGSGQAFVEEARSFMNRLPQTFGLTGELPSFGSVSRASSISSSSGGARSLSSPSASGPSRPGSSASSEGLSPGPLGLPNFNKAPSIEEALKFLPPPELALSAYTYFSGYVSWYSHPVHLATFEASWEQLRRGVALPTAEERAKAIDPFFLATFLAVMAMGLSMMPIKRALRDGFPQNKDKMVDQWLEGAMMALSCGRFLENPSTEAVRAIIIICTYFVFMSPGESSGAGMGLLSLAVEVAHSLGLHRDPARRGSEFTFFEAEERRRLFWNLFMLCILSSASLGRTWAVFDLNQVDTKLPLDCHDTEITSEASANAATEKRRRQGEETPMTSLIVKMKLAVHAKKINDRAFGIKPVSYATVLELDRELTQFEESIPARYQLRLDPSGGLVRPTVHVTVTEMRACMIQISLAAEFLRLHRSWLILAGSNPEYQYSRDQSIKYAKLLLAVYRSPSCCKQKWGGLTYKATNAGVILAIEILSFPNGSEVDSLRSSVRSTLIQMEQHVQESSLCRKGSSILRFLLEREAQLTVQRDQSRNAKRARVYDGPVDSFPSRNLRAAFQSVGVMQEPDDESHLRHRGLSGPAAPMDYPPYSQPEREYRRPTHTMPIHSAPAPNRGLVIGSTDNNHVFDFNVPAVPTAPGYRQYPYPPNSNPLDYMPPNLNMSYQGASTPVTNYPPAPGSFEELINSYSVPTSQPYTNRPTFR